MASCPKCYAEVSKSKKSRESSGFYVVSYRCSGCGTKFKLEEWID